MSWNAASIAPGGLPSQFRFPRQSGNIKTRPTNISVNGGNPTSDAYSDAHAISHREAPSAHPRSDTMASPARQCCDRVCAVALSGRLSDAFGKRAEHH